MLQFDITVSLECLFVGILLADQFAVHIAVFAVTRDERSVDFAGHLMESMSRDEIRYGEPYELVYLFSNCRIVRRASRSRSVAFGNRLRPTV